MNPVLDELKVFSGNGHPALAESVCQYLDIPLGQAEVFKFANDNTSSAYKKTSANGTFLLFSPPAIRVNDNLMELLIMIDAFKRASAGRITAVVPTMATGAPTRRTSRGCPLPPA